MWKFIDILGYPLQHNWTLIYNWADPFSSHIYPKIDVNVNKKLIERVWKFLKNPYIYEPGNSLYS